MSDTFTCLPIEKLLTLILEEEKTGFIFGIHKDLFFVPHKTDPFTINRYGERLETPIGVAAGPHTQLSQNIISSWLTGARYIELKTVQVLDELEINKPCIDMTDEGYNCEWSQELKLDLSFNEYLNAWILLHILKDKFGWGEMDHCGFIFNMSVGYNLEGILSDSMQQFLNRMIDCSSEKADKIKKLARIYPKIKNIQISDCISNNITISTMHGCPPEEIEKIGRYFIEKKKLNTTIKLNPTLLGADRLREILNTKLQYDTVVPDEAFTHDLKFEASVALIKNLTESARKSGVDFGIKLTNTLETANTGKELPKNEKMVYMSGRALHAISINVAAKLQQEFNGNLDISFCAGVDCFNIEQVLACNMKPVTVCSDILKPGGYGRLSQYMDNLKKSFQFVEATKFETYVQSLSNKVNSTDVAGFKFLLSYADEVIYSNVYSKNVFPYDDIKTDRDLTAFDCIQAPCISTCPTSQDIPAYMHYTAKGDYKEALRVIRKTNPFPNMQGMVCHHPCTEKCTRLNYDAPLMIREIKRFIAEKAARELKVTPAPSNGLKVAVIGGGPSGLSCANFLALDGFKVDVFETRSSLGGMAGDAIPVFRLEKAALQKDIDDILALGVNIHTNQKIDAQAFEKLKKDYHYIYIAIGAQSSIKPGIPGEDANGVFDQLHFLSQVRKGKHPALGKKVAVIGAGNSAMDAARTAKRLVGKDGEVIILYRRTRKEMPAELEEILDAEREGVIIKELVSPKEIIVKNGKVVAVNCVNMKLGETDASGRPRPVKIEGSQTKISLDSVIPAIGQAIVLDFFPEDHLEVNPQSFETQVKNVFAGGDALRGASTLIEAIADGRHVAESIVQKANVTSVKTDEYKKRLNIPADIHKKMARRTFAFQSPQISTTPSLDFSLTTGTLSQKDAQKEANRCLGCDLICSVCTTVCPNRANIAYQIKPIEIPLQEARKDSDGIVINTLGTFNIRQKTQIINIGDFCNECGNCTTFCPTNGSPYRTKPRFCLSQESYAKEENAFFISGNTIFRKKKGKESTLRLEGKTLKYEEMHLKAIFDISTLSAMSVEFLSSQVDSADFKEAAEMAVLLLSLKDLYLFKPS